MHIQLFPTGSRRQYWEDPAVRFESRVDTTSGKSLVLRVPNVPLKFVVGLLPAPPGTSEFLPGSVDLNRFLLISQMITTIHT